MSQVLKFSFSFIILCLVYLDFVDSDDSHICRKRRKFVCCNGYIADDAASSERLVCKPDCVPVCANATCVSPNICECTPGYEKSEIEHICLPVCSKKVPFSHCISPEKFVCDHGYDLVNDTCQPICEECTNGTCIAPDKCECFEGYEPGSKPCVEKCTRNCGNGKCVEPNTCKCDDGWMISAKEPITCKPDCNSTCEDKECLTPDVCRCYMDHKYMSDVCLEVVNDDESFESDYDLTLNLTVYEPDFVSNGTVNGTEVVKYEGKNRSWICIVSGLILLGIVILLIVIAVKYKHLCYFVKGQSYNVEEIETSLRGRSIRKNR